MGSLNKGTSFEQNKQALDLLREAGIITEASFMIGFPNETWDSIQRTIDSAIYLNPDIAVFPVLSEYKPHAQSEQVNVPLQPRIGSFSPGINCTGQLLQQAT